MRHLVHRASGQRSQAMVEFAIVAPILLVLLFGVVDLGRVVYDYVTLNQAVYEGARVAIRYSAPLPANADVETAVKRHAVDVALANPCPNGPITSTDPPPNQGFIYITQPDGSSQAENAPGGEPANGNPSAGCGATKPAYGHEPLQVTIRFNFVPFTPIIRQLAANNIIITAAAVYSTEY